MRILKIIISFVAAATIFTTEERFLQESNTKSNTQGIQYLVTGKKLKTMRYCNQFKNECNNLTPPATGCYWPPTALVGQCVFIDANGIIQNTFDA